MLIRPYVASDFAAVTALWDATGISIHYNDPAKDIPRMLATHDCQLYVGAESERVIASIMVGHEGPRGWLYKLAVLPEGQGKGLGRALVRQAEVASSVTSPTEGSAGMSGAGSGASPRMYLPGPTRTQGTGTGAG